MVKLTYDPNSFDYDQTLMEALERWTVLMYSKTCSKLTVNEARQSLFTNQLKSLDTIPPTKAALYQHVRRTLLVAAYTWHLAPQKSIKVPSPGLYGWQWNNRLEQWVPYWTALDDVSKACSILLHCGCQKTCTKTVGARKQDYDVLFYASVMRDVHVVNMNNSHFCLYPASRYQSE